MKRNHFNEAYCTNASELVDELDERATTPSSVYLASVDEPEGDETAFVGEIVENESGETVCYIEADSREAVKAIAKEAGMEDQS